VKQEPRGRNEDGFPPLIAKIKIPLTDCKPSLRIDLAKNPSTIGSIAVASVERLFRNPLPMG
jgi:hypothetical protein